MSPCARSILAGTQAFMCDASAFHHGPRPFIADFQARSLPRIMRETHNRGYTDSCHQGPQRSCTPWPPRPAGRNAKKPPNWAIRRLCAQAGGYMQLERERVTDASDPEARRSAETIYHSQVAGVVESMCCAQSGRPVRQYP